MFNPHPPPAEDLWIPAMPVFYNTNDSRQPSGRGEIGLSEQIYLSSDRSLIAGIPHTSSTKGYPGVPYHMGTEAGYMGKPGVQLSLKPYAPL